MGLFGIGKDKKTVKITDYFSAEELQTIRDTLEPKLKANEYGALPQLMANGLIEYIDQAEKEFSPGKMNKFIKVADSVKTFEPSLEGILQSGIDKYNSSSR